MLNKIILSRWEKNLWRWIMGYKRNWILFYTHKSMVSIYELIISIGNSATTKYKNYIRLYFWTNEQFQTILAFFCLEITSSSVHQILRLARWILVGTRGGTQRCLRIWTSNLGVDLCGTPEESHLSLFIRSFVSHSEAIINR